MKLTARHLLSALLSLLLSTPIHASSLSPALSLIAEENSMVKSGNSYTGVTFTEEDFLNAAALTQIDSITITSLPAATDGTLTLSGVPLAVNQSIAGIHLDQLAFVPTAGSAGGSFSFTVGGGYSLTCAMRISDAVNFAPTAASYTEDVAAWTQKDVRCYGTLEAYDPEGDTLTFEIVDYPQKGLLTLQNTAHGDFCYTPYVGCSGEDSFTYRVRDSFGNYSDIATANVWIARQSSQLVFADMTDHWAHSAAIETAVAGVMEYATESGMALFRPSETVTREDFLAMVMKALGYAEENLSVQSVFADDSEIATDKKAAVCAAYNAGIIRGREIDGQLCFCPKEAVTRAECAVILNNIIGAETPLRVSLFTDDDAVPAWAQSALYALNDLGILRGTGGGEISADSCLTRAQAAQILFNFMQYLG